MKQLLFLLLFPCLAMAQYTGNAGQKITLGEQTTADGLVWRGRLADTANLLTNKLDTSVYIVLDTGTRAMWYYRASTTPKWTRLVDSLNNLQGQLSLTTKVTGVLPVANGGTGANMSSLPNNYLIRINSSGIFDTSAIYQTEGNVGIGTTSPGSIFEVTKNWSSQGSSNLISIYTSYGDVTRFNIRRANGNLSSPTQVLSGQQIGNIGFRGYHSGGAFSGVHNAVLFASAAENFTATGQGTNMSFNTTPIGSTTTTSRLYIQNNGNVGIGTEAPAEILHVVGNARITAMNGINDIGADANGVLQAGTSDMNLKNTIENSPFGLNEILLLNPVTFLYNDENRKIDSDVKEVGFIAQDVFDIIPNAVSSTGAGDLQLDYRAITATLVKAIQEQQALIKALEQRLLILENK